MERGRNDGSLSERKSTGSLRRASAFADSPFAKDAERNKLLN